MFKVSSDIYFIVYNLYYVGQNDDLGARVRPIHRDGGSTTLIVELGLQIWMPLSSIDWSRAYDNDNLSKDGELIHLCSVRNPFALVPLSTVKKGDREAISVPPAIPPPSSFPAALVPSEGGGGLNRRADLCACSLGRLGS
jgi:hypothetical protein